MENYVHLFSNSVQLSAHKCFQFSIHTALQQAPTGLVRFIDVVAEPATILPVIFILRLFTLYLINECWRPFYTIAVILSIVLTWQRRLHILKMAIIV